MTDEAITPISLDATRLLVDALRALEWSASGEGTFPNHNHDRYRACPLCLGLMGMTDRNMLPERFGHRPDCRIKIALDAASGVETRK